MYNQSIKTAYLESINGYLVKRSINLFNKIEPYEKEWGCDLCQQNDGDKISIAMSELYGGGAGSMDNAKWAVRSYISWCIDNNINNAVNKIPEIAIDPTYHIRTTMVANPTHLQLILDSVYAAEDSLTMDNVYRGYLWLAFLGIDECDVYKIKTENVSLDSMCILFNGNMIRLYYESLNTFKNLVTLDSFINRNPIKRIGQEKRVDGNEILRGINGTNNIPTLRNMVYKKLSDAFNDGIIKTKPTFSSLHNSGLFYKTYSLEMAGIQPSFSDEINKIMSKRFYKDNSEKAIRYRRNRLEKDLLSNYAAWKSSFI